jgi:hypothetical protein
MNRRESSKQTTTMNPSATIAPASMSLRLRAARPVLALACVLGAWLLLAANPAGAKVVHQSEGSFNGSDAPGGPFTYAVADAADSSASSSHGDVYVASLNGSLEGTVDKFDANGAYAGEQLTGANTPAGSFSLISFLNLHVGGLAVDDTAGANAGDLYVGDIGNGVVDRFSSSGAFQCQITGKTPVSAEAIAHECNGAAGSEPTGGPAGIEPSGLAVDSSGDVYVSDDAHHVIDKFGPSGAFLSKIADPAITEPGPLAIDLSGNLYVANSGLFGGSTVVKCSTSPTPSCGVLDAHATGTGVDPATGHVYVAESNPEQIAEYDSAGNLIDTFAVGQTGSVVLGLTVGPSGDVYATNAYGGVVNIFGPPRVVPNVTTGQATNVEQQTATLHGEVAPDTAHGGGAVTTCQFEYGLTTGYGETAPCTPAPNYSSLQDVSASLTGLRPATTYHFRLEAADATGFPGTGEDVTLTTHGPPTIDHEAVEALTTNALFVGKINPWGFDTTCGVEYVSDASFQASGWADATAVPCRPEDLGSGFGDVTARLKVTGLAHHTTYHYRFFAANQAGRSEHPADTFVTYGIEEASIKPVKNSHGGGYGSSGYEEWEAGESENQAGAHPYELASNIRLTQTTQFSYFEGNPNQETEFTNYTGVNTKDVKVNLPPGLIGNPNAVPKCNHLLVASEQCPGDTQVGIIEIWLDNLLISTGGNSLSTYGPPAYDPGLYNVVPASHNPAEFGAFIEGQSPAYIQFHVRTGEDYGVTADSIDIVSTAVPSRVRVRVWGVPADPSHDAQRHCPNGHGGKIEGCTSDQPLKPLLTNPTSCTGPKTETAAVDSWQEPGVFVNATTETEGFTGCNQLQFKPTLEARPTTNVADSPAGLNVDLHVPQDLNSEGVEDPKGLATADLKDTKVTLPPGLIVNPASANGLAACSPSQIELHGSEPAQCPDAAKIGRVEVDTPLIAHPLPGAVYIATPYDNPFNSLLAIYVAIDDPETGVVVKLAGHIEPNPETGQLTTTFEETPQLPFEDFKLEFFGGPRAALRTAPTCGTYESASLLTPWSAPESGPPVTWSDPFQITSAPGGGPCPAKAAGEPNSPSFSAGTETPTAGSYSPFVLRLHREDDSQELKGINTVLPPGLTAKLAGVAQCPDSAIEAAQHKTGRQEQESPSCPAGSEVGTVSVGAGAGPAPYVTQGHVYLAGPYKGAPFSLAIVTPAVAGPYDLGTVVVRAALYVNPVTTQVTVKSDPIPTILDGIPLDVRTIEVKMGRPDFTLNPTSCEKMSVGGEALSVLGQSAAISDPFQVGSCEALGFRPKLTVSTSAKTSRANGASFAVKVAYPPNSQGTEANIARVKVELPKSLPARLTTLQKACREQQFAANPAGCPGASIVGHAKAITPVLNVPLEGPAYFVSHGGAAFPELIVVLQGEGVTIDLAGETFINSKTGITSSTFKSVPDAPVSSFELTLPQGPFSALTANGDLCDQKLLMPTQMTGQNGAALNQTTRITVEGCGKTLSVVSTKVNKRTLKLSVFAPGAGKVTASGKGVSSGSKSYSGQEAQTFTLTQKKAGKLKTKIKLTFTPSKGKKQSKSLAVKFKR